MNNCDSDKKVKIVQSLKCRTVRALKCFAKTLRLRVSGTKLELTERIKKHLILSHFALRIQKLLCRLLLKKRAAIRKIQDCFRKFLSHALYVARGPAVVKRKLCNNDVDFLSGDSIKDIQINQFFSFSDKDDFIYGFDILSIYNLMKNNTIQNPYNRSKLDERVVANLRKVIRLSKMLRIPCQYILIPDKPKPMTTTDRITNVFKIIDSLGNYTSASWILNLNFMQTLRFLRELFDIWNYRSQISDQVKRQICPPSGNPFRGYGYFYYAEQGPQSLEIIRTACATVLESMILRSVDEDSKTLGAYYILLALTLVSSDAAASLPWLFDAVY